MPVLIAAAILGFAGIAGTAAQTAKICMFLFIFMCQPSFRFSRKNLEASARH